MPRIIAPTGARRPLVAHVPHSSPTIPADVRAEISLSDDELAQELLRLTDWHTADLFSGLNELGATTFVNDLSRFVFDPERFLEASAEPMETRGQGVVYWRGTLGQELRAPDPDLRRRRIEALYRPYHAALDGLVEEVLADFGECLVVDCHSFPTVPLPSEIDQAPDRPDICIGTDRVHTPAPLVDALEGAFVQAGWHVKRNSPFAGTFVPSGYYGIDPRVSSVMIEVRRGLYMDETSGERSPAFGEVSTAITRAVAALLESS